MTELLAKYDNLFFSVLTADSINILKILHVPVLTEMPRWIGVLNSKRFLELIEVKEENDRSMLQESYEHLTAVDKSEPGYRCQRFDKKDDFMFDHWPSIIGYSRRTGSFLNWRYFDIPRHNYKALRSNEGEFAVYRIETISNHTEAVVRILEWNFSGESAEKAMGTVVKDGLEQGAI